MEMHSPGLLVSYKHIINTVWRGYCLCLGELGGPIVTVASSREGNSSGQGFAFPTLETNISGGRGRGIISHVADYVPGMREEDAD